MKKKYYREVAMAAGHAENAKKTKAFKFKDIKPRPPEPALELIGDAFAVPRFLFRLVRCR